MLDSEHVSASQLTMPGFTKLFNSILASTVWREDDKTRLVWITLLAMAGRRGVVEASLPGLADFAKVSLADCEQALARLMAPDPYSRTKVDDGRRVREIDGGWLVINYEKFRAMLSAEERRDYNRIKQAEHRARVSASVKPTLTALTNKQNKHIAEAEAEAIQTKEQSVGPVKVPPDPRVREFLKWFQEEYKLRRNGADYLVRWAKHGALVKALLGATELDRLKKCAQILLSHHTDEPWIESTDRGIEILSAKFSWLSDRLAAWEASRKARA